MRLTLDSQYKYIAFKMDFIDEFIKEYKNNLCLWKADSAHFKNRTKRQEAYMKLIEVASKHGEVYNIERTKQKINNLRCAFRHQLKKYMESKSKGEKEELYCPKRKYFESLMFLKDEENIDRKTKQSVLNLEKGDKIIKCNMSCPPQKTGEYLDDVSANENFVEVESRELHSPENDIRNAEPTIQNKRNSKDTMEDCSGEKNFTEIFEIEKSPTFSKKCLRKRSFSTSSQITSEPDPSQSKILKLDGSVDIQKLLDLACKSLTKTSFDDQFSNFGFLIAHKLRTMDASQAILAEKIINDVIFQGEMRLLTISSINHFVDLSCTTSIMHENNQEGKLG